MDRRVLSWGHPRRLLFCLSEGVACYPGPLLTVVRFFCAFARALLYSLGFGLGTVLTGVYLLAPIGELNSQWQGTLLLTLGSSSPAWDRGS